MNALLSRGALWCTGVVLTGCLWNQNSRDFPQGGGPDKPRKSTIVLWSVTDSDNDEEITSGCLGVPRAAAVAGQQLLVESFWKIAQADNVGEGDGSPFWCSDDDRITRSAVSFVGSLDCWSGPGERSAGSVTRMEVIPNVGEPSASVLDEQVDGQGYRFWIEVERPGLVFLDPSGKCDDYASQLSIVNIEER